MVRNHPRYASTPTRYTTELRSAEADVEKCLRGVRMRVDSEPLARPQLDALDALAFKRGLISRGPVKRSLLFHIMQITRGSSVVKHPRHGYYHSRHSSVLLMGLPIMLITEFL